MPPPEPPFVVFGKSRSRTAWLAAFLTRDGWTCHHDPSAEFDGLAGLGAFLARPQTGAVDTGLALLWRKVLELRPDCRVAVVRRPAEACRASLEAVGISVPLACFRAMDLRLDEIAALPQCLSVDFAALGTWPGAKAIYQHCLRRPLDRAWWRAMKDRNIQVDVDAELRRVHRNRAGLRRLYGDAA